MRPDPDLLKSNSVFVKKDDLLKSDANLKNSAPSASGFVEVGFEFAQVRQGFA